MVSQNLQFYRGNTGKKGDNSVSGKCCTKLKLGDVTGCCVGVGFRLRHQGRRQHLNRCLHA